MVGCFQCWGDDAWEVSFHYGGVGVDEFHSIFVLLFSINATLCSIDATYSLVGLSYQPKEYYAFQLKCHLASEVAPPFLLMSHYENNVQRM